MSHSFLCVTNYTKTALFDTLEETLQAIAEALYMTVDVVDTALADLAPLKRLTENPPT